MTPAAKVCVVCGEALSFQQAAAGRLCGKEACRRELFNSRGRKACTVCGRLLSVVGLPSDTCDRADCRTTHLEKQALANVRRRKAELRELAASLRERRAAAAGVAEPKTYSLAVIPRTEARPTPLPAARRRAFRASLIRSIRAAGRPVPSPAPRTDFGPHDPAVRAVLGRACGQCRGLCCRAGRDHGFVSAALVRLFRAAHPELTGRQVLAAYLARLPDANIDGSCVYHGDAGCALPRDMRSDVCNKYYCHELWEYLDTRPADGPARAFLLTAVAFAGRTAAFVDADGVREVPVADG